MVDATIFKFGVHLAHSEHYAINAKLGQRGHDLGHVTCVQNFAITDEVDFQPRLLDQ